MASHTAGDSVQPLSPDEAFAVLGNEIRMSIIKTLGDADGALSFTDLRNRVGLRQGAQFNYHLEKLREHFVRHTESGYELRQPGRRVVEAVLSGALTETPTLEPTRLPLPCQLCGAPTIVSYREERVSLFCTECAGFYGRHENTYFPAVDGLGHLGSHSLPPAGLRGRTARDVFTAAETWQMTQVFATAHHVCPRCAAPMEHELDICKTHDSATEACTACGRRHAVRAEISCTNCIYHTGGVLAHLCLKHTDFLAFLTSNGVNPSQPLTGFYHVLSTHEEELHSHDPLEAQLTFTINAKTLKLTIDNTLNITTLSTTERETDK